MKFIVVASAIIIYVTCKLIKRRRKIKKGWEEFVSEFRIDTSEWGET